jgi:hypothetical protein
MKLFLCSSLLLLTFSLNAQAPVPLAHGNVPGEPHHHLKIENEYVRAYYVEVPPHEDTLLHQHDHDYLFVTLGATEVINAVLGKPEVKLALKDGEVRFTRGGFAHIARNLGDKPFRNVTIELLKPQDKPHNVCSQVISSDPVGICGALVRADYKKITQFRTAETRLELVQVGPNARFTETANEVGLLIVSLSDSGIKVAGKGKPEMTLRAGELAWFDADSDVQISNGQSKTGQFLEIALKVAQSQSPKT